MKLPRSAVKTGIFGAIAYLIGRATYSLIMLVLGVVGAAVGLAILWTLVFGMAANGYL